MQFTVCPAGPMIFGVIVAFGLSTSIMSAGDTHYHFSIKTLLSKQPKKKNRNPTNIVDSGANKRTLGQSKVS